MFKTRTWLLIVAVGGGLIALQAKADQLNPKKTAPAPAGQMVKLGGVAANANKGRLNLPGNPGQGSVGSSGGASKTATLPPQKKN